MLEAVFGPADREAEAAGGEADQDDVGVDGRLDPERATRVPRRDEPQLGARQPQRRRRDGMKGEGPWKFAQAVSVPVGWSQSQTTP